MNERILLVDDEEIPLKVLTELLEVGGYRVEAKQSSKEALLAFTEDPHGFDAIISDQFLDNAVLGTSLAREFLKVRPDITIVLCTGDAETIRDEAISLGVHSLIQKPITINRLLGTVASALRKERITSFPAKRSN